MNFLILSVIRVVLGNGKHHAYLLKTHKKRGDTPLFFLTVFPGFSLGIGRT
jgi:hypothetical protein